MIYTIKAILNAKFVFAHVVFECERYLYEITGVNRFDMFDNSSV